MTKQVAVIATLFFLFFSLPLSASTVSPDVLLNEGIAHVRAGEYERGIQKLEAARLMRPRDIRMVYQLGMAYYNLGVDKDSIAHIEQAQLLWRQAAGMIPAGNSNSMMKKTLEDISERAEARKGEVATKLQLEKALRKDPQSLEEGLKYAAFLKKRGRHDDAARLYQRLAEAHQTDPRPFTQMAMLVHGMGRILWAERYYGQALERDPSYAPAQKGMAELHKELESLRVEGYDTLVKASHPH